MAALPAPLTVTDELLVALHEQGDQMLAELVGLRADLAAVRGGERPVGELLEPKPARRTSRRADTPPAAASD